MKKLPTFLSIGLFFINVCRSFPLHAQQDTIAVGRVVYFQSTRAAGDAHKNGVATLYFNAKRSLYIHQGAPKSDTSFSTPDLLRATITGDPEGFPILKLHLEQQMLCKVWCPPPTRGLCIVSDTMDVVNWLLHPNDRKRFGQYSCRRATGLYRGRTYDVWYSEDIPIPSGPFKLGGLPGLILEAKSSDGVVSFEFLELAFSPDITQAVKIADGKPLNMSILEARKSTSDLMKKQMEIAKSKGVSMTVSPQETIEVFNEN